MPLMVKLQFEKEVLGQYFSEHPTVSKKKNMHQQVANIWDVVQSTKDWKVNVVGLIQDIKRIRTKKGESMAFVTVQDETGSMSVTLFPEEYAKFNSLLEEQQSLLVEGKSERRKWSHSNNRKHSIEK